MPKRILTVVLQVEDAVEAAQLWGAHAKNKDILGCKILSIAEGDKLKELALLEDAQDFVNKYRGGLLPDEHD